VDFLGGFGEGFDEFGEARVVEQVGAGGGRGELHHAFFGLLQAVDGLDPSGVFVRRFAEDVVSGLGFHEARSRNGAAGNNADTCMVRSGSTKGQGLNTAAPGAPDFATSWQK